MPLTVQCSQCSQAYSVPDDSVGESLVCRTCGAQFVIDSEAPLMPPPLAGPGAQPALPITIAPAGGPPPPSLPLAPPASTPPASTGPTSTGPTALPAQSGMPVEQAIPSAPPRRSPHAAVPPLPASATQTPPPPPPSPPPVAGSNALVDVEPVEVVPAAASEEKSFEATERAARLNRKPVVAWAIAVLVCLVLATVAGIGFWRRWNEHATPNPPLFKIEARLDPRPVNRRQLEERQTGGGYSFELPPGFVPDEAPSTTGLPDGSTSYGWTAKSGPAKGSLLYLWIIPQSMDIRDALSELKSVERRIGYSATIFNHSDYHRIGKEMLAVRGLLTSKYEGKRQQGVIFLIADKGKTLMLIGMGVGPVAQRYEALLDTSVRTIEREGERKVKEEMEEKREVDGEAKGEE